MLNRNINSQVLFMAGPTPPPPPPPAQNLNAKTNPPNKDALLKSINAGGFQLKKVPQNKINDRSISQTGASGVSTTTNSATTPTGQPKQKPTTPQAAGTDNLAQAAMSARDRLKTTLWKKNDLNSTTTTQNPIQITNKPTYKASTNEKPPVPQRSNAANQAADSTRNKNNKKTIQSPENPSGSTNSISKINFEKQSGFLMALVKLIVNFCRIFYSNAFHAKQTDPEAEKMSKMFKDVNTSISQSNSNELSTKLGQMKNCIEIYNKNGKPCFNQFRAEQFNELIDKAAAKNLIQISA